MSPRPGDTERWHLSPGGTLSRCSVADRYELTQLIATGGMGHVWRARDLLLGRTVAVKVLRSEFSGNETFLARFRAEAQHAAVLAHDGIAAVHDYGEVPAPDGGGQLAYLVMELVDGEPLSALLAREGRLDAPRTLALLRQAAAALAAAHEAGVVHRDVKPGNLLVSPDGRVTVTDFGIAWSAASVPLTQTGQVVGTAHYLSPEQAEGRQAGPASDVYALGMIAYECLAGRRAFDGDNAVQIALRQIRDVPDPLPDDVPDAVRSLVGRMLLKDPAARFPDGAAVRARPSTTCSPAARCRPRRSADGGTRPLAVVWPAAPAVPAPRPPRTVRRRVLGPAVALLAGAGLAVAGLTVLAPATPAPVAAATAEEPERVAVRRGGRGRRLRRPAGRRGGGRPGGAGSARRPGRRGDRGRRARNGARGDADRCARARRRRHRHLRRRPDGDLRRRRHVRRRSRRGRGPVVSGGSRAAPPPEPAEEVATRSGKPGKGGNGKDKDKDGGNGNGRGKGKG